MNSLFARHLLHIAAILCAVLMLLALPNKAQADVPPGSFLSTPYSGNSYIFTNYCFPGGHNGYDYGLNYQPVLAAASGTVTKVAWVFNNCHEGPSCDYGLYIFIQHSDGYETRYAHLSSTAFDLATSGTAQVTAGTIIGTSGDTGNSGDPHLHFEVRRYGVPVDPGAELGGTCNVANSLWKDGQWAGHPTPVLANSGQIEVEDTMDNSQGFSKGSGGIFNNVCTGNCGNWMRFLYGYFGDMYRTFANGYSVNSWARWNPAIGSTANYEVFVHTPNAYATSWQAPFHIAFEAGEAKGRVDQEGLDNRWVSLGIYRMNPGNYVYLTDASWESAGDHCGSGQYCQLGADAVRLDNRRTLHQLHWRGDQFWSRNIPMTGGSPQYGSPSAWVGPGNLGYMPGSGTFQTESMYVVGSNLWFTFWRNNQGYYRTIPIIYGQVQWANGSSWSGVSITDLVGSGDMQTQSEYVVGGKVWQTYWRGDQGWYRTIPVVNGAPDWNHPGPWPQTPLSLNQVAGSGPLVAQTDYVIGNLLYQFHWRNNGVSIEGWHRTVPINAQGNPDWNGASSYGSPPPGDAFPGSGTIQSRSDFVLPP